MDHLFFFFQIWSCFLLFFFPRLSSFIQPVVNDLPEGVLHEMHVERVEFLLLSNVSGSIAEREGGKNR